MEHDAVVVGGSLAGCTTALLLARRGLRVAVVEQRPDPAAYKKICGHFIQAGAVPAVERAGLLAPMLEAGAVRSQGRLRTRWGWSALPEDTGLTPCLNLRREKLDPLLREIAAAEPGVEMRLGHTVRELVRDGERVAGVVAERPDGGRVTLRAPLVVGADGRESRVAKLAGLPDRPTPNARFGYAAYYEGPPPDRAPDGSVWFLDPDWAAAFPTDSGLTMYAVFLPREKLPPFKRDPAAALEAYVAALPDAPPIARSRRVGDAMGKIDLTNRRRGPVGPGVALVGDAALAADPLWGVGCGWAFESAEWLADAVAPALRGEADLARALRRYARTHGRRLGPHVRMIDGYATGRRFDAAERAIYAAAARDPKVAEIMTLVGTRTISPVASVPRLLPRVVAAKLRSGRRVSGPASGPAASRRTPAPLP